MPERVSSAGCTSVETNGGAAMPEDGYEEVRQAAWGYAQDKGWTGPLNDVVWEIEMTSRVSDIPQ